MQITSKLITHMFARRLLTVTRWAFFPVAVGFIAYYVWVSRDTIVRVFSSTDITFLIYSILAWTVLSFILPANLCFIIKSLGSHVSYKVAFYSHVNRLPARYIPGGIWHTVARFVDLKNYGVGPKDLSLYLFLENIAAVCLALIFGGIVVLQNGSQAQSYWVTVAAIGVSAGGGGLVFAYIFINRLISANQTKLLLSRYCVYLLAHSTYWFFATTSFVLYFYSFPDNLFDGHALQVAGYYLFSWGIGYLAFFAPQGIGVFEVVFAVLLNNSMEVGAIAVLVAGFRVIVLIADFTTWFAIHTITRLPGYRRKI